MPSRGRGGGGRRGGGAHGQPPREVTISKALSFILRHKATAEGIDIDEGGWARVSDILAWRKLASLKVTFEELQAVVANNDKQRFVMMRDPELGKDMAHPAMVHSPPMSPKFGSGAGFMSQHHSPYCYLIRAAQGHSMQGVSSEKLLNPITLEDPTCPTLVVHGTYNQAWTGIQRTEGLKPMSRKHIHFATGPPADLPPLNSDKQSQSRVSTSNSRRQSGKGREPPSPVSPSSPEGETMVLPGDAEGQDAGEEVISGMRRDATILIWVDVKGSLQAGHKWWRSANGVILTEGIDGKVGLEWVVWVERRGVGEVLYGDKERGLRMKKEAQPSAAATTTGSNAAPSHDTEHDTMSLNKLTIGNKRDAHGTAEDDSAEGPIKHELKENWDDP